MICAVVPERIGLQVVDAVNAGRPARVERIERLLDGELALVAVAQLAVGQAGGHPAAEDMRVAHAQ